MMFHSVITPSKLIFSSLVLAGVMASIHLVQAKSARSFGYFNFRSNDAIKTRRGGCAAFGHSCFGGHGKRTDKTIDLNEVEDLVLDLQVPSDDARTFMVSDLPRTHAEIFNGGQLDNNELNSGLPPRYQEPMNYVKLSPVFRKWLASSYRKGDLFRVNK